MHVLRNGEHLCRFHLIIACFAFLFRRNYLSAVSLQLHDGRKRFKTGFLASCMGEWPSLANNFREKKL